MTKFQCTIIACAVGILVFVAILGWAGNIEFTEQVILHMSQEQYDSVKNHLTKENGVTPSDSDIAHWWADHQDNLP